MSLLGLVGLAGPRPPRSQFLSETEPKLLMEESIAGQGRLWIRGKLFPFRRAKSNRPSTWRPWLPKEPSVPTLAHLETRIGGSICPAEICLENDGRWEAMLQLDLPQARRGWQIARHRFLWQNQTFDACSLVARSPEGNRAKAIVILPLFLTGGSDSILRLRSSAPGASQKAILESLEIGSHDFYYAACRTGDRVSSSAELALALSALGWPAGNVVMLPAGSEGCREAVARGIDRLRWLFSNGPEVAVINLEPVIAGEIPHWLQSKEKRAAARILEPSPEPCSPTHHSALTTHHSPLTTHQPLISHLRPARAGLIPRHPVVFCHGLLAFTTLHMSLKEDCNCFRPLGEFVRQRGFRALFPSVLPTGGVADRARQLRDQILLWTDEPVNLIAHSMGGLDARYLITHLGMGDKVRSLTTIATPHRGSVLVDWFIANYRRKLPLLLAFEKMGYNVDGFRDCCPAACRDFNARTPDYPGVGYFSYGAAVSPARLSPVLRRAWALLSAVEGPNDGMVSLASARWGEYLGTLQADHFAQTPDMTFVRPNEDFDALGFYFRMLEDLARRGF